MCYKAHCYKPKIGFAINSSPLYSWAAKTPSPDIQTRSIYRQDPAIDKTVFQSATQAKPMTRTDTPSFSLQLLYRKHGQFFSKAPRSIKQAVPCDAMSSCQRGLPGILSLFVLSFL